MGGSPLRLFRLTAGGRDVVDRLGRGERVAGSRLVEALLDAGAIHPLTGRGGSFTPADVTVVVPTLGPAPDAPAGAIVVDDGSEPPVPGATVRLDRNAGPAAARNAGLARVTTPLVAFVDADVRLPDGWLDALLPHFDDERVAVVAPRVRSRDGSSLLERLERDVSPLDMGPDPARVRAGSRVSYVPAAALVCRTEAVVALAGFDESLRFGEDVDLVWRLDAADHRIRYEPASVVEHDPRSSWADWFRQRIGYGSSAAPLARRHPGALAPIRMSGWSVGAWAAGVAVNPVAGLAIAAGSAAALVPKLRDVPPRETFRIAWSGNLHAGAQLAQAIRRVWWPIVAVAALGSLTARRVLVLATLAARTPIRLADDVAYSVGVWRGMLAERTFDPAVPAITSWPGRSRPRRGPTVSS